MIRDQLAQHRHEAVDGVGRLAVRAGQPADRVIGAIHLVAAVDQEEGARSGMDDGQVSLGCTMTKRVRDDTAHGRRAVMRVVRRRRCVAGADGCRLPACRDVDRPQGTSTRKTSTCDLDGSATVYVNAAVPALVALRGVDAAARPVGPARSQRGARALRVPGVTRRDRQHVAPRRPPLRAPAARGRRHPPAGRAGRRSPGRATVRRSRRRCAVFTQRWAPPRAVTVGDVGWKGDELVAFRLHLPSRVPSTTPRSRTVERGNIIVVGAAARRAARRASRSTSRCTWSSDSILVQTLVLFGAMVVLALAALGALHLVGAAHGTPRAPVQP